MLLKAKFLSQDGVYERVFNTNTVIYFDERGMMFAPGTHAKFAPGEYDRIMSLLRVVDPERVMV